MDAFFLELEESFRADSLDFGYDDVGLVFSYHRLQCVTVEHREYLALISHLHGRRVVVAVACHYIDTLAFCRNHKLLAQFA